jgi:hypothetical protein
MRALEVEETNAKSRLLEAKGKARIMDANANSRILEAEANILAGLSPFYFLLSFFWKKIIVKIP